MLSNDNPSIETRSKTIAFRSEPYQDETRAKARYDHLNNLVVIDAEASFTRACFSMPPAVAERLIAQMHEALDEARSTKRGEDVLAALRDTTGGDMLIARLEGRDAA